MAYSDDVANVANGEDTGAGSNWDYSLPGALARLTKRNPLAGSLIARAARSTKPTAQPGTSDVAGAGKDSSGPNGPGMSSPHLAAQPLNVRPRADYASGNPDDFQPYDPEAPTLDSKPASFPRDIAQAPPDQQASLAPQGGSNKLVRALARLSGQAAKSPEPGQPYVGPGSGFTVDGDNGNIRKQSYAERTSQPSPLALLGRALQQVGASMGTPQQKLWAAEQPQQEQEMNLRLQMAQNEANYRRGMLGYHDRANDISEAKAQTAQTKTLGDLRAKGYKVDEGGNVAPMSEDEILSDPVASRNQQLAQASIESKRAQAALAKAHQDALMNPDNPTFAQRERQIQAQLAMAQQRLDLARSGQALAQQRFGLQSSEEGLKLYQPALDSEERLKVMRQNYVDGLKGDQQSMLSLLANHLGMTMGLQKGARLNQAIVAEAQQSRPWLQGLKAKFDSDGYLSGVTLTPEQMRQMVSLGEDRFRADVSKSRRSASMVGLTDEPQFEINPDNEPEPLPKNLGELGYSAAWKASPGKFDVDPAKRGTALSADEARAYLRKAAGDKNRARQLATQDGRHF